MIELKKENEIAILRLNRPGKRNALHPGMVEQIKNAVADITSDKSIKALIITGEGSAFCAGADLEYLNSMQSYSSIENEKDSENLAEMFLAIHKLSIPTIAAVNGPAIAGGCGLASVCDFVVADSKLAKFGYTEVKIGFLPAIVSIFLIKKIGLGNAKKLLLTGEIVDATNAKSLGFVDYIADNVIHESQSLAKRLLGNSLSSYAFTKSMLNDISAMSFDDAVNYGVKLNTISRATEDFSERIKLFLTKK
jgi:methylglutaconyl-CoA hydratase